MSPTCRDMSATTQRVAPILARWVRVADTKYDVVAVCVGLSRHFTKFSEFVCRNILWYGSTHAQIPNAHFCHVLHSVMFSTHTHTTPTRIERTLTIHTMNSAPQHHPPMPPSKAMGAIPQNRRGHPTATPWSTWDRGFFRFHSFTLSYLS